MKIDELLGAIRKIQKIPDEAKVNKIADVLSKIDEDQDGAIRIDTALKVSSEVPRLSNKRKKKYLAKFWKFSVKNLYAGDFVVLIWTIGYMRWDFGAIAFFPYFTLLENG